MPAELFRLTTGKHLGKHAIVAGVDADNAGSFVFDERLGFVGRRAFSRDRLQIQPFA
jgi:L-amino acid N-acyltransferase YncA